jgi:long-chain acyl-CoA synthetase
VNFFNELDKYSDEIALITENSGAISYKNLLAIADRIALHIENRCLVFIVCKNSFESIAGYVGFQRFGQVIALIDANIDDDFFLALLEIYKPEYVYMPKEGQIDGSPFEPVYRFENYVLLKSLKTVEYVLHKDLNVLLTTSGSTGTPKFVRQSYKNIDSQVIALSEYLGITSEHRAITTMPMSYSYGLSVINSHFFKGASLILTDASLVDPRFWNMLKANKATTFGGVPFIYEILKKLRFRRMNLPSLKYITQAGGKLNNKLMAEFAQICEDKSIDFYVMYGQTEATARISYLPCEYVQKKVGSVGIPIPGGKMWIEDTEGNRIDRVGVAGELVYQGDNVTLGYAENYLDLAKGDKNKGFLRTGDIAECDEDGFFTIVGRTKRFLKMYGNRINLDEIEQLITEDGYDCACSGEDNKLVIYLTKSKEIENIKSYISTKMKIHPSGIDVRYINKVPRNESGKILYSELT